MSSWERAEAIRKMVSDNVADEPASRSAQAWRRPARRPCPLPALRTQADGPLHRNAGHNIPRYSCWRGLLDNGEPRCIAFGGLRVDDAIEEALLEVVEPGAIAAALEAEAQAASSAIRFAMRWLRDLEAARYAADRAFRQYDAIDPENRLVAAELEARWNRALAHVGEIEGKIAAHDAATPVRITDAPASLRRARRRPPDCLVGADDRCEAQEAHRAHRHPRGGRRYR